MDEDDEVASNRRSTVQSRTTGPSTPRRATTTSLAAAVADPVAVMEDDPEDHAIPRALITRIIHQGLNDKNMKISKEAVGAMEMYTKIFVKEAIARSKQSSSDNTDGVPGIDDGWLQVEDLEKIAPQLVLDF